MLQTMRWFGPDDPVSLSDIRQAGCSGIVTSLHQFPAGVVWSIKDILERKQIIEKDNQKLTPLHWEVVESILVHDDIKRGKAAREKHIEAFQQTIRNLADCGIHTICYNFMPVLDWSRTDVKYSMPDGSLALRFVWEDLALFDLHILNRAGAEADYDPALIEKVSRKYRQMSVAETDILKNTILMGLPGTGERFEFNNFRQTLLDYHHGTSDQQLRENLYYFIRKVAPVAEETGSRICIHPDDPPFPLLGLPRIVSTEDDLIKILNAYDSPANGITFCTGSLGVRPENDLPGMFKRLAGKIHFIHLRSVKREPGTRNFFEAGHLYGDVDMYAIIKEIVKEQVRRKETGAASPEIPMRPDHGHKILDDFKKVTYPGYSAIGRLKGLAEIRGVELAVERILSEKY